MLRAQSPSLTPRLARRAARFQTSEIRDLLAVIERPGVLSLAGGLPAAHALPAERIALATDRALGHPGRYGPLALQYGPTPGLEPLRALIAGGGPAYPASAADARIVVTTGSQQALDLVARVLVDPGDAVVVEDPVYLGARQALAAHGARLVGVPSDAAGLDTTRLAELLTDGLRPRLVYCVPNFSNPSGSSLPTTRRTELAELAQQFGFVIIEDDPYRPLHFGPTPPAPIAHIAPDHTVYLGSASKFLAPGLRVGWLAAPAWLLDSVIAAKQSVDLHTPPLNQLIVADLLADDDFLVPHLARLRTDYETRAAILHSAVSGVVDAPVPTGGMFLWGRVGTATRPALVAAVAAGVAYVPGPAFGVSPDAHCDFLRLSFATLDPSELVIAADRLRGALAESA